MCQIIGRKIKQGVGNREQQGGSGWTAVLCMVVGCPADTNMLEKKNGRELRRYPGEEAPRQRERQVFLIWEHACYGPEQHRATVFGGEWVRK